MVLLEFRYRSVYQTDPKFCAPIMILAACQLIFRIILRLNEYVRTSFQNARFRRHFVHETFIALVLNNVSFIQLVHF